MQRLAARLAMQETVILDRHADGTVAVRIFTPYVEPGTDESHVLASVGGSVRRPLHGRLTQ